jgi:hypothetical protein
MSMTVSRRGKEPRGKPCTKNLLRMSVHPPQSRYGKLTSTQFPQHSYHSWRDRWLRQLKPALERRGDIDPELAQPPSTVVPDEAPVEQRAETKRNADVPDTISGEPTHSVHDPSNRHHSIQHSSNSREEEETDEVDLGTVQVDHEQEDTEVVEEDSQPYVSSRPAVELNDIYEDHDPHERQFYRDLRDFLHAETQMEQPFNPWPKILGRTVTVWNLWQAAQSQKVDPAERDWDNIAETLGYDWVQLPSAPAEVRRCYETLLSDFENALQSFEGSDGGEENENESMDATEAQPASANSGTAYDSSPPKQPSLKRRFDSGLLPDHIYPDHIYPESSRKRTKINRDSEIPSTPDTKNGTARLRLSHPVSAAVSPSDKQYLTLPKSSRAANHHHHKDNQAVVLNVDVDDEMEDQVPELPVIPNSRIVGIVEPETQDFRFDPQTQNMAFETQLDDGVDSEDDITPSQQLRSESDARSDALIFSTPAKLSQQRLDAQATPTPRRLAKSPFVHDYGNEDEQEVTPKPRFGKGPNPLLVEMEKAKRSSLPPSFVKNTRPVTTPKRTSLPGPSRPTVQKIATPRKEASPPTPSPVKPKARSKAEELVEVVEYWMSLGYSANMARQCLEATTWEPGLAGSLMQRLKGGEPIPTNWEGVWSPRDDQSLLLIDSAEPPKDDKEQKKRTKAMAKLMDKHGQERMNLRRQWLITKATL